MFIDNIFYVLWLDPQHNLYPDKNHGGLVKIQPPSTCCKEREIKINELLIQLEEYKEKEEFLEEYIREIEEKNAE